MSNTEDLNLDTITIPNFKIRSIAKQVFLVFKDELKKLIEESKNPPRVKKGVRQVIPQKDNKKTKNYEIIAKLDKKKGKEDKSEYDDVSDLSIESELPIKEFKVITTKSNHKKIKSKSKV